MVDASPRTCSGVRLRADFGGRTLKFRSSQHRSNAQVNRPHEIATEHLIARAGQDDAAAFQQIAAMRQGKCEFDVLFIEQDCNTVGVDKRDHSADLIDRHGRQTEKRLSLL